MISREKIRRIRRKQTLLYKVIFNEKKNNKLNLYIELINSITIKEQKK